MNPSSSLSPVMEAPSGSTSMPVRLRERQVPSVPPPCTTTPPDNKFYVKGEDGTIRANPHILRDHFFHEGRVTEIQAMFILEQATQMLSREPNLITVQSPVTICGDIHGQYYDLMKLFDVGGNLNDNCYLFLGDYVDRGCFGIECLLYLYALKLCYPTKFVLLRGNHECRHLTEYFTFKRECLHKYSLNVYEACITSFQALPVAAVVDNRFFCVHGGISPELMSLDDINKMNRFEEPGGKGLLCDLLWSDPVANFGHEQEPSSQGLQLAPGTTFLNNQTRGCSFFFTYEAACQFLDRTNLLGIIRGHEAQDAGYTMHRKTPSKKFPSVITIFSAPNYLDVYHNRGAVIKYANKNITIRQYNSSSHPYWLPNFMDAFTWSLPFVGAKIADMLLAVLSVCSSEELTESDSDSDEVMADSKGVDVEQRRQQIKNKILAVGRMQRVFQILREEAESASELTLSEEGNLTRRFGGDALGVQQINRSIRSFDDARKSDMMNERLPTFHDPGPPSPGAVFPPPSMRLSSRRGSADGDSLNMEYLIRKTLEEENGDELIEALAEKVAHSRRITGRPSALKRHDTT
ncbi:Metallo-dependent phosphatase [Hymenopellis radicata]|nr:Metallo-dependent phosphatase [Hymenopellis radicata]